MIEVQQALRLEVGVCLSKAEWLSFDTKIDLFSLLPQFFIFSHFRMTEYFNIGPEGTLSVCVCLCVSVCVCVCLSVEALAPKRLDGF